MRIYSKVTTWCWRTPVLWRLTRILPKPNYRAQLLSFFPKNAFGAEIGVWRGDFSSQILKTCTPKRLYLVDPWNVGFGKTPGAHHHRGQHELENVYQSVVHRFREYKNVVLYRSTSSEYFVDIGDEKIDFIYLDGDHSEDAVSLDLHLAWRAVKRGGTIAGDDYFWADEMGKLTVKSSVDRFCKEKSLRKQLIGDQFLIRKN